MGDLHISKAIKLRISAIYVGFISISSIIGHLGIFGSENSHYFAQRHNILNKVFVKNGWLWFTAAFLLAWSSSTSQRRIRGGPALARYAAATGMWILFSQWFFGAPLMDQIFTVTGGACVIDASVPVPLNSRLCKANGGSWKGGHDPSGHVFLLVLTGIVTLFEFVPMLKSVFSQVNADPTSAVVRKLGISGSCVMAFLALNLVMLFFTCVYFHSFLEKTTGLAFAFFEVYIVYFLGESACWGWIFGTEAPSAQAEAHLVKH